MKASFESASESFEGKVLRKIYDLTLRVGNGKPRRRWLDELYDIYGEHDIVQRIWRWRIRREERERKS